jgi:hypothetical protein
VVPHPPAAAGVRVQLGASPVSVVWPGSAPAAFLEITPSSAADGVVVVEGLHGATVEACSTPWTRLGACRGTLRRLPLLHGGAVARMDLGGAPGHLKVSADVGRPLVLLAAPA